MVEFEGIIIKLGMKSISIRLKDEKDYKKLRIGACSVKQEPEVEETNDIDEGVDGTEEPMGEEEIPA